MLTARHTTTHNTRVLSLCVCIRSPDRCCWGICVWPRSRVSVSVSSWCEEHTWTRRESWQRKRDVKIPSTRAGRTPMKGATGTQKVFNVFKDLNLVWRFFTFRFRFQQQIFIIAGHSISSSLRVPCVTSKKAYKNALSSQIYWKAEQTIFTAVCLFPQRICHISFLVVVVDLRTQMFSDGKRTSSSCVYAATTAL